MTMSAFTWPCIARLKAPIWDVLIRFRPPAMAASMPYANAITSTKKPIILNVPFGMSELEVNKVSLAKHPRKDYCKDQSDIESPARTLWNRSNDTRQSNALLQQLANLEDENRANRHRKLAKIKVLRCKSV